MIIPSIDLMDGKAVQLVQGKKENKKLEVPDVAALAAKLAQLGDINVIDLDAAFGSGTNKALICQLAQRFPICAGGGIRTIESAEDYLQAGVQKVIIGSAAFRKEGVNTAFLDILKAQCGKDNIIIALDSFEKSIVKSGWTEKTLLSASEVINSLEPYCRGFLYTQVDREGLMGGTDINRAIELRKLTKNTFAAAGGISSIEEIKSLWAHGISSVLGMALYTGRLPFEALIELKSEFKGSRKSSAQTQKAKLSRFQLDLVK